MRRRTAATLTFAAALAALAACGGAPAPAPPAPARAAASGPPLARLGPARYVLTDLAGVVFDTAGRGSPNLRREPALHDSARLLLEGGVIVASAPSSEPLVGFTSVPARLGGGFLLWSRDRTFHAPDFLGPLTPVAEVAAVGGARPFLRSMVLRTPRGLLELPPLSGVAPPEGRVGGAAPSTAAAVPPGVVDVVGGEGGRGVRLDLFGRASVTRDGGATWVDVQATEGALIASLAEEDGRLLLVGGAGVPAFELTQTALVRAPRDAMVSRRFMPESNPTFPAIGPEPLITSSRMLAPETLARAAASGALLPGGRILATRPESVTLFAAATTRPILETALRDVEANLSRCQPIARGDRPVLLACTHDAAHVLRLDGALDEPRLEATFPERGRFFATPRGDLAFAGRCGQRPPSPDDFLKGPPQPAEAEGAAQVPPWMQQQQPAPTDAEAWAPADPLPPDDARACVRGADDDAAWREIRLRGEDARRLYRWIPGEGGRVTALVIEGTAPKESDEDNESERRAAPELAAAGASGARVIRVRPDDPALQGGRFPATLDPERSERFVDADFWEDDDGAIRGWIHLPEPKGEGEDEAPEDEADKDEADNDAADKDAANNDAADKDERPRLPLSERRGGRVAGVRIDATGRIDVYPLPPGVTQVVYGGLFALALALADDRGAGDADDASEDAVTAYHETTDGGRTWQPVAGPPVGRLAPPSEPWTAFACSPVGCTLDDAGLVRLGWGGPPPRDPPPPPPDPAPARRHAPEPPLLRCRIEGPIDPTAASGPASPRGGGGGRAPADAPLVTVRTRNASPLGALRDGVWTAAVAPPFAPAAAPRRLTVRGAALQNVTGSVAPILRQPGRAGSVDLMLLLGRKWTRAGDASPALLPFEHAGLITAAAELPGGGLAVLDTDKGVVLVAGRDAARPALWLSRVPSPGDIRLTLGARLDGKGLTLVGYSATTGEVFAGALELSRAEVGPLSALGALGSLEAMGAGACQPRALAQRFVAGIPVALRVEAEGGRVLLDEPVEAAALLGAGGGHLCAEGVEARVELGGVVEVRALFGTSTAAAVRGRGGEARARCEIEHAGAAR